MITSEPIPFLTMNTTIRMSDREALLAELQHGHDGDPWHGPSRSRVLADVTLDEAVRQPAGDAHGIWALALHMWAWTREVTRRLAGNPAREPAEGDWPPVPSPSADAWARMRRSLDDAHAELTAAVRAFPPERLDDVFGDERNPPLGSGVTYRAMLHGLAQHDAYHTGQIAILKRLYRDLTRSTSA